VPCPVRFAAGPFAQELERLFKVAWPSCNLALTVSDALVLDADPDLLAQVLINFLRNAAQATRHLADPHVRLAMAAQSEGVLMKVEDKGPGIPEASSSDIFLPFYSTRRDGSGIGLNLVRQIAVASGWPIEATSGALGGALMRLLLPRS
jgi:signal transduction histidine kinase